MYPKTLVLSNECFSRNTSNGRTLGNFFLGWPKECLAQFFLSGSPDDYYCEHYFQVSDRQALNAILGKKNCGSSVELQQEQSKNASARPAQKLHRNAHTMLIREAVWASRFWEKSGFWQWVSEFSPDIVLLQAGDCAFMFRLALRIAKKLSAKLVIYNTEGYYFKDFDYFRASGIAHYAYPVFRCLLRKAVQQGYRAADYAIFNCDALQDDFCREFPLKSKVIYTATDLLTEITEKELCSTFVASYAGNLGVGRSRTLIDVANCLRQISQDIRLDVYGTVPDAETQMLLNNCENICFHGSISYEEVKQVIQKSDLIIHVESFDPFYVEDLKYAFSTKIADALASNRCFLMYGPDSSAEFSYLQNNSAAYVIGSQAALIETMRILVQDPEKRNKYCANALALVKKNHDRDTSVAVFQKILCELVHS